MLFNPEKNTPEMICLIGILFGYGFENSYPYSWFFEKERKGPAKEFVANLFDQMFKKREPIGVKSFSSRDFSIPGFKTFSNFNPTREKYEKERKKIMGGYKGKDLANTTLTELYSSG